MKGIFRFIAMVRRIMAFLLCGAPSKGSVFTPIPTSGFQGNPVPQYIFEE
jgi:hypothetical protein